MMREQAHRCPRGCPFGAKGTHSPRRPGCYSHSPPRPRQVKRWASGVSSEGWGPALCPHSQGSRALGLALLPSRLAWEYPGLQFTGHSPCPGPSSCGSGKDAEQGPSHRSMSGYPFFSVKKEYGAQEFPGLDGLLFIPLNLLQPQIRKSSPFSACVLRASCPTAGSHFPVGFFPRGGVGATRPLA